MWVSLFGPTIRHQLPGLAKWILHLATRCLGKKYMWGTCIYWGMLWDMSPKGICHTYVKTFLFVLLLIEYFSTLHHATIPMGIIIFQALDIAIPKRKSLSHNMYPQRWYQICHKRLQRRRYYGISLVTIHLQLIFQYSNCWVNKLKKMLFHIFKNIK